VKKDIDKSEGMLKYQVGNQVDFSIFGGSSRLICYKYVQQQLNDYFGYSKTLPENTYGPEGTLPTP
jgi:hypothetical protein